jgi:methyl-accepting chemotaxis protein
MVNLGMWLQDADSLSSGNSTLLMIFVGLVALAMLTQTVVVVIAAIGAIQAKKHLMLVADELKSKALPVVERAQEALQELQPKIRVITDNVVETSHVVRSKAQEFDTTFADVNQRARAQTARVDDMVTSVLDTTSGIASTIQKGVQVPVREFHGIMNGLKAGIDVLVGRKNHTPSSTRYRGDDGL